MIDLILWIIVGITVPMIILGAIGLVYVLIQPESIDPADTVLDYVRKFLALIVIIVVDVLILNRLFRHFNHTNKK